MAPKKILKKSAIPTLDGFTFNEKLGLYVTNYGLLGDGGLDLNGDSDESQEFRQRASDRCSELYNYSPCESGYNYFAYLAAGSLGLLSGSHESIEFTLTQALELAKLVGVRLGTNKEFIVNDGHITNLFGRSDVAVLLGDVYDFTRDDREIDVYVGIATVLQNGKKYKFFDENGETIKPIRVKGAQAKALRNAGSGEVLRWENGNIAYRDEAAFLNSGKRVTEFDENGIPCTLDNEEYGCILNKGKYPHAHDYPTNFIGHRWVVKPKGLVVMHQINNEYLKPVGRGVYRKVGSRCPFLAPTTYLTQGLDDEFWRVNIFAVAGLENRVDECLRSLVLGNPGE